MTKKILLTILILIWSTLFSGYVFAESEKPVATTDKSSQEKILSVDQIVDSTNHVAYYQGADLSLIHI